jgi:predicted dehydrogenase
MGTIHVLDRPPGVALIGGGFIGPVHAEALRRIGVPVVGLLGSSPERARPTAERLGIGRVYRDLDELLGDPEVGAVHVASPNGDHFEQARRALEAGRHVVCEKPLAVTSAETGTLARLAEGRPSQAAAVNYNIRFYPICREMRARIARGDLGRVLSVSGSYTQDWLLYPTDYNWRVEPDGGTNLRAVADIGTHWMDLAQFVVGRPIMAVMADLATFHPERRRPKGPSETFGGPASAEATEAVRIATEDHAAMILRLADGVRGLFQVSQVMAGRKNRLLLEVAGTEGAMSWDSEAPDDLWLGHRGRPNELLKRDPALLSPEAGASSHYPGGHAEGFPDTFKQLSLAVYGWIASGGATTPPFPTFADGDREVRLCEAIARSAAQGRWADVLSGPTGA